MLLGNLGYGVSKTYRGAVLAILAVNNHLKFIGLVLGFKVPLIAFGLYLVADLEPDAVVLEDVGVVDFTKDLPLSKHLVEVLL